jgi:hypothetical protein
VFAAPNTVTASKSEMSKVDANCVVCVVKVATTIKAKIILDARLMLVPCVIKRLVGCGFEVR